MVFRVISKSNETMESLEKQDMDFIFKLNEYLDIMDYITETSYKDQENKNKAPAGLPRF
jgi:hypothetical protein